MSQAFEKLKSEPQIQEIISRVKEYNKLLMSFGIRDHQVKDTYYGGFHSLKKLVLRAVQVVFLFTLAAPGYVYVPDIYLFLNHWLDYMPFIIK
jgi:glycerol-3-phosphate O-acyltransferase/dihydroxyacetone phosphate acyltransferase